MPNWNDVLKKISDLNSDYANKMQTSIDSVRHSYLKKLSKKTGRNIIAYYSAFLSKPKIDSMMIDEDKNGFMMAIHNLDRNKGLDLILHTQGGDIAATESIVDYLHKMFGDNIRAIIPQIAMSAGTMLACSCKSILMGKHSNLGPIDPQLCGIPAHGVLEEFTRACEEVSRNPSCAVIWAQIISKYNPTFLKQCQNAITWSELFVQTQLKNVMFKDDSKNDDKAKHCVAMLSDFNNNKSHSRHIHMEECIELGLKVEKIEEDDLLQDLTLTVHHCYMHSLMNTSAFKIIENQNGVAFVKHQLSNST